MDLDYFLKINNTSGTTSKKDTQLYNLKSQVNDRFTDTIDFYNVKVSGVSQDLLIVRTTVENKKTIKSRPNEDFKIGDIVVWNNNNWLVTAKDTGNQVYTSGKMELCNYTLPFQSPTDYSILYYPCITSGKTYSNDENQVITLPSNQKSILLPFDEYTNSLSTGKRLFVDKTYKVPYEILGSVDNTTYNYGDKGLIYFIVKESQLQETDGALPKDNQALGICNYIANYTVELSATSLSLDVGTTSQITAVCKTNGVITPTQTVTYTSSDVNIATVSSTGLVTAIASGTVTITATWVEQNKTATLIYSIASSAVANIASISVVASGSMLINTTRTITATAKNTDLTVNTTENLTWNVTYPSGFENLFTETVTSDRIHKITLVDTDDWNIVGKFVSVTVSDTTGTVSKTLSLKIGA